MNQKEITNAFLNCALDGLTLASITSGSQTGCSLGATNSYTVNVPMDFAGPKTVWDYWTGYYYPNIIRESYPVYIQERSMDKGQKAFEVLKVLIDKKIVKMEKVTEFVDAMDALIKIL